MKIKIQEATTASFRKYGQIIEMNPLTDASIATAQVKFWKQQAAYYIKGKTEIGVLKVKKSAMVFSELENHFITPTVIIPMDGDFIMAVAGPSDKIPPASEVEAFHLRKDQLIVLHPKAWHGATYPVSQDELTLLIIFEENSLENDTAWVALNEECSLYN